MKLHWGNYLVLGMGLFMAFIISMAIYMFSQTKDDYDRQYYEKGINYDADYNREKQVITDKAAPQISFDAQSMRLKFPAPIQGKIRFIRAADKRMDKLFSIQSQKAADTVFIGLSELAKGPYRLRMEWQSNQKQYLYEQEVTLK
ncbi:FixH family protein [Mucilaginibacter terrae]|uniref:Nitrogen fixation protein FixH n=1 Tax=Mucilaginibacter terrae TaxID=1955052 RepID=A0ABU3GY21_9SPHI|nr:FixH family protein [Mucilaginibacter terrae]MDT3403897.1 hypothetical protein [Mucilaginibacter terrae]